MNYKKYVSLLTFIILFWLTSFAMVAGNKDDDSKKQLNKTNTNDNNKYIAINQIFMWVSNNGMGSHDPRTDGSGFYWPGGENAKISAIYEDGLIWGAKVGRETRVNGSTYRHGLQAGKILPDGTADDPNLSKYRIYKIRKGWESLPPGATRDAYETDYKEWPFDDGAPYTLDQDGNKVPKFVGDEVLWCVSNDMDLSRSTNTYGTAPMGLEQQMTVFGFNRTGDLGDMVFKKYTLINKGTLTLRDMYLCYWSDTDLGNAVDDYTGCDTILKLGYTYNGDDNDENYYGAAPPSVGYVFFQGPMVASTATDSAKFLSEWRHGYKNLPMTGFSFYINTTGTRYQDPDMGVASGSIQFYYYMTGKNYYGEQFIDPWTTQPTNIILSGDPVAQTGWYEGTEGWPNGSSPPNDRRHLMSSGPFTMAPGDTQEVVVGIVIARGTSNLNSVTELKKKTGTAQIAYDNDFSLTPAPDAPKIHAYADDKQVTLYWDSNAESYDAIDKLILGKGKTDTTYTFEGYRIWQFSSLAGSNPTLLETVDLNNNIAKVTQTVDYDGVKVEQTVFNLPNAGLKRVYSTRIDKIKNISLVNGSPYYFAVTAFGYSPESDPKYLENPPQIIEVRPATLPIDVTFDNAQGDYIPAKLTTGKADGEIKLYVVDPLALTGDTYTIAFDSTAIRNYDNSKDSTVLAYSLINISKSPIDTLLKLKTDINADSINNKLITDGFSLVLKNTGLDSIRAALAVARVKSVLEVSNGKGNLATPIDVLNNLNSTKKWSVKTGGINNSFIWQTKPTDVGIGTNDYEIRFTGTSQFYVSRMALQAPFDRDAKLGIVGPIDTSNAIFTHGNPLPFQIFQLGSAPDSTTDDKRLLIKILDKAANSQSSSDSSRAIPDSLWSRTATGLWEEIYAYEDADIDANADLPIKSGTSIPKNHKFGQFVIRGELPESGTIIRMETYKPFSKGVEFTVVATAANVNNVAAAKNNIDKISVFPNPYFGSHALEESKYNRFVRFIGLPKQATITIVSLSGVLIKRYQKSGDSQFLDWDLKNLDLLPVASGMYIAYIEVPGAGTKVLKIAIIQETQYLDRI